MKAEVEVSYVVTLHLTAEQYAILNGITGMEVSVAKLLSTHPLSYDYVTVRDFLFNLSDQLFRARG